MPQTTERTFTADIASRINSLLQGHPELHFREAKVEERRKGNLKRRDLTLYDMNGRIALTGEVKMPDNPDGRSPFQQGVVEDAHQKGDEAEAAGTADEQTQERIVRERLESRPDRFLETCQV
jgi:hypothetical protein